MLSIQYVLEGRIKQKISQRVVGFRCGKAGEMAKFIQCLLHKQKGPSSGLCATAKVLY